MKKYFAQYQQKGCASNLLSSYFVLRVTFLVLLLLLSSPPAYAKVVGTYGQLYEIAEQDMLKLIEAKAAGFDFDQWKYDEMLRISNSFSKFRPTNAVSGLPPSTKGVAYRVDLTYSIPYDVYDINGNVLYPRGFTFNPLELMRKKGMSFTPIIVVLNGLRKNEIEWFNRKFADPRAEHILLLLTDGYALELAEELERPVYYLSELLRAKFQIRETPSVVIQNSRELFLTVKPYVLDRNGKEMASAKGGR